MPIIYLVLQVVICLCLVGVDDVAEGELGVLRKTVCLINTNAQQSCYAFSLLLLHRTKEKEGEI
jgi:hypothetical protein